MVENVYLRRKNMEILEAIEENIIKGKFRETEGLVKESLELGKDPNEIIQEGLSKGMAEVGRRFRCDEYYLPEVMVSARAMNTGLAVLKPLFKDKTSKETFGSFLIGTVEGDLHDIGKNIVSMIMEASGFKVFDLGIDIKPEVFVREIREKSPDLVGLSALLSTTVPMMEETIDAIEQAGLRDGIKVLVGGAPVDQALADKIGADAYGEDALECMEKSKEMLKIS
jgi:5-methyltetrahydrofolate--homocysteine methyltransferase